MSARRVLVTDGEQRSSLAVVRSLGRAGHAVHVTSTRGDSIAGASRHCRAEHAAGSALDDAPAYRAAVRRIAAAERAEVVIPMTEPSLLALLGTGGTPDDFVMPFVDRETFARISDKQRVLDEARCLGIAVPEQRVACDHASALAMAPELRYPVVLKPSRSVASRDGGGVRLSVSHVDGPRAFKFALAALDRDAFPLLVQQRIVGPGIGIFLLRWDGRTVARFAHRRLREKPPAGGVSVCSESAEADPALVERSIALLDAFAWRGVAMVEYKVDGETGVPYLMEVNGRFWGSLQLAIDCGVDFPALLVALALGERPAPVESWAVGRRNRWWWGEVDHVLARLRHAPAMLALPPDAPPVLGALGDLALPWRPGRRGEVLRLDDPLPFVRESLDWLRGR